MGTKTQTGFTIIEVMLFLAVTGLLAIGILAGSGLAISQQRYRDSVTSLKSYLQQQYNETANVVNSRDKTWDCNSAGTVTEESLASGQARGTSDCVILGRYITVDATGTKLTSANVVGYRSPGAPEQASDMLELTQNYNLGVSPIEQSSQEVAWGSQVVKKGTSNPMSFALLIMRSPLSGSILTFSQENIPANVKALITLQNTSEPRDLCVNADPGSFVGNRMAVRIGAYAASADAIQIPPERDNVCA